MSPTFLFVHGLGCDRNNWAPQVDALSKDFNVHALDLPGHGTAPLPEQHRLAALAQAVVQARAGCNGPVILVGHSMGCRLALEAFRQSAQGVAGLVFLDGSATLLHSAGPLLQMLRDHLQRHGMSASLKANFEDMFVPGSDHALREAIVATALRLDHAFAESILKDLAQWDAAAALQPVVDAGVPVLAIQSTALGPDMKRRSLAPGMGAPWSDLLLRLLPHARVRIVAGVGHFVHHEAADVVNEELLAFGRRFTTS